MFGCSCFRKLCASLSFNNGTFQARTSFHSIQLFPITVYQPSKRPYTSALRVKCLPVHLNVVNAWHLPIPLLLAHMLNWKIHCVEWQCKLRIGWIQRAFSCLWLVRNSDQKFLDDYTMERIPYSTQHALSQASRFDILLFRFWFLRQWCTTDSIFNQIHCCSSD